MGHSAELPVVQVIGPSEEFMGDVFGGAMVVRLAFDEQVPDDDEETVGDDYNGVVGMFAVDEFLEAPLLMGMTADGAPGDLDHGRVQVFVPLFGGCWVWDAP